MEHLGGVPLNQTLMHITTAENATGSLYSVRLKDQRTKKLAGTQAFGIYAMNLSQHGGRGPDRPLVPGKNRE